MKNQFATEFFRFLSDVLCTLLASGYYQLPASGYRDCDSGGLDDIGSDGNYWSASYIAPTAPFSGYLYFNSGNVDPLNNDYRSYGYSVRCARVFTHMLERRTRLPDSGSNVPLRVTASSCRAT